MNNRTNRFSTKVDEDDILTIDLTKDYANMDLPDPDLVQYYKNLNNRCLWIYGEINSSIMDITKQIILFNQQDKDIPVEERKPIKIFIYSYGGDGEIAFNLIDTILLSKTPVYTYNMGVAMSAGLLILLSGHKRYCLRNSTALIHSGSGGTSGTFEQTEAQMKDYKHFVEFMRSYVVERTKIDEKTYNKHKSSEWFIYAAEQISLGVVDDYITSIEDLY